MNTKNLERRFQLPSNMKLRAILNADLHFGIEKKNGLLFHLPKDMAFFKETTMGHTVCMGENTLLSFPHARPLKGSTNIVLSKDESHNYDGVINVHSMDDFKKEIQKALEKDDVYIIGGASIYAQMLPYYDEVYLTRVEADGNAEVFFPNLDNNPNYKKEVPILPAYLSELHKLILTTCFLVSYPFLKYI